MPSVIRKCQIFCSFFEYIVIVGRLEKPLGCSRLLLQILSSIFSSFSHAVRPSVRQFSLSFSLSLPRESSSVSDLASSWKEREEGESQREARSVQVSVWSLEAQNRQRSAAAAFLCYSHSVPSVSLSDTLSVKVQSYTI
jgi:hypothetical protein